MFFLRNDQGQVMLMTGQPQAVPGAGGVSQSAGTTVFRVCDTCFASLYCIQIVTLCGFLFNYCMKYEAGIV